jgi:hypothetical protein
MAFKFFLALVLALYCSATADAQAWGSGAIWQQKINWFFKQYDLNKNGIQDDPDRDQLVKAFQPYGLVKQGAVGTTVIAMWVALYAGVPPGTAHNATNLIKSLTNVLEPGMETDVLAFTPDYFQLLNTDTNPLTLTNAEWNFYFVTAQGFSLDVANGGFTAFDLDGNGALTQLEFTDGWSDYFTTNIVGDRYNNVLGTVN